MKKIVTSLLIASILLLSGIDVTLAWSADDAYRASQSYFSQKTILTTVDEILAYEALGLESDTIPFDEDIILTDYASDIAKTVIALTLHGDNPNQYQGVNYVEMLEACVQDNGAFDLTNDFTYANYQVYGVYALYTIGSAKTEMAADYLAGLMEEDESFGSAYGVSLDVTGWCIEALSLVNQTKYQSIISQALQYICNHQEENGGYKDDDMVFGDYTYPSYVNANTQACVLMGLLTYDAEGVKGTTYNQGENNPFDVLLTYQNEDGSFWYSYDGEDNFYATMQGAQAIGYYYHGSVYEDAREEYQEIINPTILTLDQSEIELKIGKTVQLTANQTVVWSVENANIASVNDQGLVTAIKEGTTVVTATSQNGLTAKCVVTVTAETIQEDSNDNQKNVPETGDSSRILWYCVLLLISGIVMKGKIAFGKEN